MQKLKAVLKTDPPVGDGGAVFISEGTEEDYEEHDRLENKGWKGFYKKITNLNKDETNNK